MRALVTASAHFAITEDGTLWTPNPSLDYRFWSRYLDVYDDVHLLARAKLCANPLDKWKKASGVGIQPVPLPDFLGALEFVKHYPTIRRTIQKALAEVEAIQLRLPCSIGTEVWRLLTAQRPYGIEVVADPYDSFAAGSVKHPLRSFFRWQFTRNLKQQCLDATAALYVTKQALQARYPCPHYSIGISDVDLSDELLVSTSRSFRYELRSFNLILVGSLAQLYKAPDVLIKAVSICVQQGLDLKLTFVGDGKYRQELEKLAATEGVSDRVHFQGQLFDRNAVIEQLDQADIFVLPSHQEGLPRAMIEAMARGLPCIGSVVGGIPELLASEDLVPPGDVTALAAKIQEVTLNPTRMARMSDRNLNQAREYCEKVLHHQRIEFYRYVRNQTELWLNLKANSSWRPQNPKLI